MGNTEARQTYLNGYKSPIKDFQFDVTPKPIKPTVEMIAKDSTMNMLLATESAHHYEALIEPKMHYLDAEGNDCVNRDDVSEVVGKYISLPIDYEIRILKIQNMLNVMKKVDNMQNLAPTINQLTNGVEVNLA
jgi:hypothetical protein